MNEWIMTPISQLVTRTFQPRSSPVPRQNHPLYQILLSSILYPSQISWIASFVSQIPIPLQIIIEAENPLKKYTALKTFTKISKLSLQTLITSTDFKIFYSYRLYEQLPLFVKSCLQQGTGGLEKQKNQLSFIEFKPHKIKSSYLIPIKPSLVFKYQTSFQLSEVTFLNRTIIA